MCIPLGKVRLVLIEEENIYVMVLCVGLVGVAWAHTVWQLGWLVLLGHTQCGSCAVVGMLLGTCIAYE